MRVRRILQAGILLAGVFANAASQKTVRLTVLDAVTRSSATDSNNGVPQNCEQLTFDAYCRSTTNVPLVSTLLVQEDSEPPFRISCTIDSRYSRCIPLPKGESFDARKEKHGFTLYYVDDKGKARKQLYTLVDAGVTAGPTVTAAATVVHSVPSAGTPPQSLPAPAAAPAVGSVQAVPPQSVGKAKCHFSTTPAGAEITLDGKYVGSTPSDIELLTGTHVVVFSIPGFAEWKRELTVLPGSELTVNGILQRQ